MRWTWLVLALVACSKDDVTSSEGAYVKHELATLEQAMRDGNESGIVIECVGLRTSVPRMAAATAAKVERLCDVEGPRLLLKKAIDDVNAKNAEHPEMPDLNCFQLFAGDAFKAMARSKVADAELEKLAAEYTRLCPAAAGKLRQPPR